MTRYQIVSECAYVTVNTVMGRARTLLLKGALVDADAPELEHLIAGGFVVKVGDEATGGVDAAGVPSGAYDNDVPTGVTSTPVVPSAEAKAAKADAEVAEKRAAAKAKLPQDGSAPDGRAAQAVWVEYLVSKGSRYEDVQGGEKAKLQELAEQQKH